MVQNPPVFPRLIAAHVERSLAASRVTVVVGPRQAGKSTLVRAIADGSYVTLDDAIEVAAASADPGGFISRLTPPAVIDEVQHVPALLPAVKLRVDRDDAPGQFVLTGSADVLTIPTISESLAGRAEFHTLWPLAQAEIHSRHPTFIDAAFAGHELRSIDDVDASQLYAIAATGGFPEAVRRADTDSAREWQRSYITALIQRDLRDRANIRHAEQVPSLLTAIALRSSSTLNITDLSRDLSLTARSVERYLALLAQVFAVIRIPAWRTNLGQRLVKAPKLLLADSGLTSHLCRVSGPDDQRFGTLLEALVGAELMRLAPHSDARPELLHFRDVRGAEVDFVLEDGRGRIVGIEVKSSGSVVTSDFRGMRKLQEVAGDRFARGIVLHPTNRVRAFGDKLEAWPMSSLWSGEPLVSSPPGLPPGR